MRKILFVAAASLSIAACGSKTYYISETAPSTKAPATTTTDAPVATAPKPVYTTQPSYGSSLSFNEQNFIDSVYNLFPGSIYLSDQDLLDSGYLTCTSLQSGMTGDQLAAVLLESSEGDPEIFDLLSAIAASAIVYFCPDQSWKVG